MTIFRASTTVEQDNRPSEILFRASTRFVASFPLLSRSTQLHVDEEGLIAMGDLGVRGPGKLCLSWNKVLELHFAPGGFGEIGGLYAQEGAHCSRCILPGVTEIQASQVIAAIALRFPTVLSQTETEVELCGPPQEIGSKSLQLLPSGPTRQTHSLSHALNEAVRSILGRKHESARRIH